MTMNALARKPARICASTPRIQSIGFHGPGSARARAQRGQAILLSIGYSACHWCHVMAHESFEDAATAH